MPEPLDYHNPLRRGAGASRDAAAEEAPGAMRAVPIEFDASVARTGDHAALRAIEASLGREGIAYFLGGPVPSDARTFVGGEAELFVRAVDATPARLVAAQVFARRQKLKSYPRQRPTSIPYSDLPVDE